MANLLTNSITIFSNKFRNSLKMENNMFKLMTDNFFHNYENKINYCIIITNKFGIIKHRFLKGEKLIDRIINSLNYDEFIDWCCLLGSENSSEISGSLAFSLILNKTLPFHIISIENFNLECLQILGILCGYNYTKKMDIQNLFHVLLHSLDWSIKYWLIKKCNTDSYLMESIDFIHKVFKMIRDSDNKLIISKSDINNFFHNEEKNYKYNPGYIVFKSIYKKVFNDTIENSKFLYSELIEYLSVIKFTPECDINIDIIPLILACKVNTETYHLLKDISLNKIIKGFNISKNWKVLINILTIHCFGFISPSFRNNLVETIYDVFITKQISFNDIFNIYLLFLF